MLSLLVSLTPAHAYPCTGFLLPQSPDQVVAVDMDWQTGQGLIFINKRDVQKTSAFVSPPQTPLQWISKYMSITLSQTGLEFPWEGMNEKGLSAHIMLLQTTALPPTSDPRPAVNGFQWMQYILDTSATTAEAITNAQGVRVTGPFGTDEHYLVCDATGSCATFDYIAGELVINQNTFLPYTSLSFMALSNNTFYQSYQNLVNLVGTLTSNQILALSGQDSLTRFAKAAILSSQYTPQNEEISYAFSALNVLVESDTQWKLVFSLANQTLQYKTTNAPFIKYVDLRQFNPSCSAGIVYQHLNEQTFGDRTSSFLSYTSSANNILVQSNTNLDTGTQSTLEYYPASTQCMETATVLTSSVNPSSSGQRVVLTARVTGTGATQPTGMITFKNGSAVLGTVSLNSLALAQFATSTLPVGTNFITATYGGDAFNLASASASFSQGVGVQATQTTLGSSLNPAKVNQLVTLTSVVTSVGSGVSTGTVTFQNGSTLLGTATLNSSGLAQLTTSSIAPGTNTIIATYSGDARNATSTSAQFSQVINLQTTQTSLISSLNPSLAGQPATFTAAVAGEYGVTPTGTLTFTFSGTASAPIARLQNGSGSITRGFLTVGTRPVVASYSGDGKSQASASSSLSQGVNPQPTQVTLASSINPSSIGQNVTFTAAVAGLYGGSPTGTVTFTVNGNAVATVAANNGQASYTTSYPTTGTQVITASYSGDGNDKPSVSSSFSQLVNTQQPTQTSLSASVNPSVAGQSVMFTATVTAQNGGPTTGTITFNFRNIPVAIVLLNNGQASYIRNPNSAGARSVTATYSGDSNNQPSTSSVLDWVVNPSN